MMLKRSAKMLLNRLFGLRATSIADGSYLVSPSGRALTTLRPNLWSALLTVELQALFETHAIDLVLDVGANDGGFARYIRNAVGYTGRIVSFEPVRHVYANLEKEAATDKLWHAHNIALGSSDTQLSMHVSEHSVFSSIREVNEFCVDHFGESVVPTGKELVDVRRLDSIWDELVQDYRPSRVYLKMDTQGYDAEVFSGLGDKRADIVALQSEVSVLPVYHDMEHWLDSISRMEAAGFSVTGLFPVNRDGLQVIEFDCLMVANERRKQS